MTSITVEDMTGSDKEDHFFDVNNYPEANFEITEVNVEKPAHKVNGNLTIKGETKNISFPVDLSFNDQKKTIKLSANDITIDRTEWGINFMSKSIMDNVKDKFINDEIKIKFVLKADQ